jgi:rhodanese-related sulfurtransferase
MAEPVRQHLLKNGVDLRLSDAVAGFEQLSDGGIGVSTKSGQMFPADLVVLSIGVRPEISLAQQAGLAIGERGGIRVSDDMRTSDPNIWAVGDAVETVDFVTGQPGVFPLAGPANRQGRVAADSICGRKVCYRGTQATAVCGVFGMTVASTGANEKTLRRAGITAYHAIYLHPSQHVGYYPGAKPIHMKLLFSPEDGRVLGAQAVGTEGVEKRIDVISMTIQNRGTVFDMEEAELCYAPQYGAAKDPVNMAGMIAANVMRGDVPLARWQELNDPAALILDVREPAEFAAGHIERAVNIPLPQLRRRLQELPKDREIKLYCGVGLRSYNGLRILLQHGFKASNLPGGFTTYQHFQTHLANRTASAGKVM